jgi:hypothetical protein
VLSEDGQKVMGTFSTMPSTLPQRDLKDQNTLVMFAERPAGQPQAAREWFYPGRSIGEEFIYPKPQAQAIANANNTSVAASEEGKVVRVEPESGASAAPRSAAASRTPAQPEAPAARQQARQDEPTRPAAAPDREPASVGTSGQAQPQAAQAPARTLPRTASDLPVLLLLSGLSLFVALGIHRHRSRSAASR